VSAFINNGHIFIFVASDVAATAVIRGARMAGVSVWSTKAGCHVILVEI
jgi:hypothetical protein